METPSLKSAVAAILLAAITSSASAAIVITAERDAAIDGSGVEEPGFFIFDTIPTNVSGDLLEGAGASISVSRPPSATFDLQSGSLNNLRNGTAQTTNNNTKNLSQNLKNSATGCERRRDATRLRSFWPSFPTAPECGGSD